MAQLRCVLAPSLSSMAHDGNPDVISCDLHIGKPTTFVKAFGAQGFCLGSSVSGKDPRFCSPLANGSCRRNLTGDLRVQASSFTASSRDLVIEDDGRGGNRSGFHGGNNNGGGGGGEGSGWGESEDNGGQQRSGGGLLGAFLQGWKSRTEADPEFAFKVLMEELVGVSACVLGDMASRPNFGLNELDFVFSTLVVGSILNFVLMYLLAPSSAALSAGTLPGFFASCPTSHMFEPGAYGVLDRLGTFVYKGALFATVGFGAGLVGTVLSNTLISIRKKMDPNFEIPNKPPPPLLNSFTWALHMGLSSNFRYQTLNGIEFLLAKGLPPFGFKASVVVLRCLNNVLGGVSFVLLARLTGAQKVDEPPPSEEEEKAKLLVQDKDLQPSQSS